MFSPKTLAIRPLFKGRIVDLSLEEVQLPNGNVCELERIRHPGAAAVVPIDQRGDVWLVRQYRHATGGFILEVPAGKLDAGESPEACARREIEEEVGRRTGSLQPLGWIWTTPGFTDERIWLFLATELEVVPPSHQADEVIEVVRLPFRDAIEKVRSGEIVDAKSICALYRAADRLGT